MGGTVFTVGHGTRTAEELVAVLREAGVGRLVDVRRFPGSRRHPQFGRDALAESLPGAGIAYEWRGEELGGRRSAGPGPSRHPAWREPSFRAYADHTETPQFRRAVEGLAAEAAAGPPPAVMCAETLWWRCHRRLIADVLVVRGIDVRHLRAPGAPPEAHPLNPSVRAGDDGWPVWDVGVEVPLPLEGDGREREGRG